MIDPLKFLQSNPYDGDQDEEDHDHGDAVDADASEDEDDDDDESDSWGSVRFYVSLPLQAMEQCFTIAKEQCRAIALLYNWAATH